MPHALTLSGFIYSDPRQRVQSQFQAVPFLICTTPPSVSSLTRTWQHLRTLATSNTLSNTITLKCLQGCFLFLFLPSKRWWQQPEALQVQAHLGHVPALRDRGAVVAVAPGWELAVVRRRHLLNHWLCKTAVSFLFWEKGERPDGQTSRGNWDRKQPAGSRWPGLYACRGRDSTTLPWQCLQQGPFYRAALP